MRKDSKILTDIGGSRLSVRRPAAGRRLPACALVLCIASFLLAVSCQRKEILMPEYNAVVTILDGSSTRTPGDSDPQINDIAIFAFSEQELVGYIYESGLASGKTIFPMTLTKGGAIDFYVIANSEPGFFKVVDQDGTEVSWSSSSTVNPPANVTPEYLKACKVTLGDNAAGPWYAPMTNLPGAGGGNRTFDVDGMTRIPIELTRAVSKVEVWFRTLGDIVPEDQTTTETDWITNNNPSSDNYHPATSSFSLYYSIDDLSLKIPVESVGIYEEVVDHTADNNNLWQENKTGPFDYIHSNNDQMFLHYEPDQLPSNFYSDKYFVHIWTCYIFPNTFGGNMAGESSDQKDKSTLLSVRYSQWQHDGVYRVLKRETIGERVWFDKEYKFRFYWEWSSTGEPTQQVQTQKVKDIYLPPIERNTSVRVWCPLGDDTDRSFTYTVVDWDETVTVNVPDFN